MSVNIEGVLRRLFWADPGGVNLTQEEAREIYELALASYDADLRDDRDAMNETIASLQKQITQMEDELDARGL